VPSRRINMKADPNDTGALGSPCKAGLRGMCCVAVGYATVIDRWSVGHKGSGVEVERAR
jgi:hypothetical protein